MEVSPQPATVHQGSSSRSTTRGHWSPLLHRISSTPQRVIEQAIQPTHQFLTLGFLLFDLNIYKHDPTGDVVAPISRPVWAAHCASSFWAVLVMLNNCAKYFQSPLKLTTKPWKAQTFSGLSQRNLRFIYGPTSKYVFVFFPRTVPPLLSSDP